MIIRLLKGLTVILVTVLFLVLPAASCSGGADAITPDPGNGDNPGNGDEPGNGDDPGNGDEPGDGLVAPPSDHNLFGFAGMRFDPGDGVYVVDRTPAIHYNLTSELSEPLCPDCIEIETIEIDDVNHIVKLLITLRNPTTATYYDVRGIMVTNEPFVSLDNPDGYITLFDDGGDIEWNPYYAYCLENDDRSFAPNDITKRFWYVKYTPGESMDFTLVVEGSYPGHCEDVTRLFAEVSDDSHLTPWEQTGELEIFAEDWQWDVDLVHLHIPDLGIEVAAHITEPGHYKIMWSDVGNLPAGTFGLYVEAWSPNPEMLAVRQYGHLTVYADKGAFYGNLAEGYICRGANPMRNNRVDVVGPNNLDNKHKTNLGSFLFEYPYEYFSARSLELRSNADSQYFYGLETTGSYYGMSYYNSKRTDFLLLINSNGELVKDVPGGNFTVLNKGSITSQYKSSFSASSHPGPNMHSDSNGTNWQLCSYSADLIENASILGGYFQEYGSEGPNLSYYAGEPVIIYDSLPLPNGRILMLETHVIVVEYYDYSSQKRIITRDPITLEQVSGDGELDFEPNADIYGAATSPDGHIYFFKDDEIVCLGPNLKELWSVPIASPINEPAIALDGTVFVATLDGIQALKPDGTALWSNGIHPQTDFAVNSKGDLVLASIGLELFLIAKDTGEIIWVRPLGHRYPRSIVVDAEDKIYVGTGDYIYLFDRTGNLLDSTEVDISYQSYNGGTSNLVLSPNGTLAQIWYVCGYYGYYASHNLVRFD